MVHLNIYQTQKHLLPQCTYCNLPVTFEKLERKYWHWIPLNVAWAPAKSSCTAIRHIAAFGTSLLLKGYKLVERFPFACRQLGLHACGMFWSCQFWRQDSIQCCSWQGTSCFLVWILLSNIPQIYMWSWTFSSPYQYSCQILQIVTLAFWHTNPSLWIRRDLLKAGDLDN